MTPIKLMLVFIASWQLIFAFTPRTEKAFSNNLLRLLKSGNYELVEEYFEKYYPKIAKSDNKSSKKYLITLFSEFPDTSKKKKLLLFAISTNPQTTILNCFLGEIYLVEEDYTQAAKYFSTCPGNKKNYYLGLIAKNTDSHDLAISFYKKALSNSSIHYKNATNKALAEIYRKSGDYKEAKKYANKMGNGIEKEIELYKINSKLNQTNEASKNLQKIKSQYSNTLEAKAFLFQLEKK